MEAYCDDGVDALYLRLANELAEGVIEITEGVNTDTTSDNRIVSIEILHASKNWI
ncbi:MAG: DUF2283 domain-containing protein [Candidatus Latescibacteria bacterium]|nr:DUF2283 domain-containing protein [Candidatus Latescibacterota bacterium]